MPRIAFIAAVALATAFVLACRDSNDEPSPSPPTQPPSPSTQPPTPGAEASGSLAFVSDRDGDFEIYVIEGDGSGLTNLTNTPNAELGPSWSPDGERIAFYTVNNGVWQLNHMNADGSGTAAIADIVPGKDTFQPAWSPDGKRIAFESRHEGNPEIYVVNADGSGLTNLSSDSATDSRPAWSPDGARIAFASERDNTSDIYSVSAEGSGLTNLTGDALVDRAPSWSPDGETIVFASEDSKGRSTIRVIDPSGGGPRNLGAGHAIDFFNSIPVWSPDGRNIAFRAGSDIYVMSADGAALTNLTNDAGGYYHPVWSPDGCCIAFASIPDDGGGALYIVEVSSSARTDITEHPAGYYIPSWSRR